LATRIASTASAMRKEPQQARARATTEAILDAVAHILGERGWAGLTTNGVADRAGVIELIGTAETMHHMGLASLCVGVPNALGKGRNWRKYLPLTHLEQWLCTRVPVWFHHGGRASARTAHVSYRMMRPMHAPGEIDLPGLTLQRRRAARRKPPKEIKEVFLGATVRDLGHYRTNVQEALRRAEAAVYLQEDWSEAAAEVVNLSCQRLEASDAYMLLLGYRYGFIPARFDASVTEIECRHALSLWEGVTVPPIFLFVPEPGKLAATELEALAETILAEECADEALRARNRSLQMKFRNFVLGQQLFCQSFGTLTDLREKALASIGHYRTHIYKNAIEKKDSTLAAQSAHLAPADLGSLGRPDQLRELSRAWRGMEKQKNAPGMCIVVHGTYSTGQVEFIEYLKSGEEWKSSVGGLDVTPSSDTFEAEAIARTVLGALHSEASADNLISTEVIFHRLAQALLDKSADERQVLFVGELDRMNDGLTGFHRTFWLPLHKALREARPTDDAGPKQATIIVDWREKLPRLLPEGVNSSGPVSSHDNTDFTLLIPLPELGDFTRHDVEDWLRREGLKGTQLDAMTDRVLAGGGNPREVYDRLREESRRGRLPRGEIA
jgi:Domain of unknown function (DUF4062)